VATMVFGVGGADTSERVNILDLKAKLKTDKI
jgi:hypothetical protein